MSRKASAPSSLEIHLLGPSEIMIDGVPVQESAWKRPVAKHLLYLLALHPHRQLDREQLMGLLWPEQDTEVAATKLDKAIHFARHALEPKLAKGPDSRFIVRGKQQILLRAPGRLWIDSEEFEAQSKDAIKRNDAEAGEAALALYRGDLLVENQYADWATSRREYLRLLHRKLLTKLAQIYEDQGEYQRSIGHIQDVVKDEPTDERAHRQLMRVLALAGSKFLALEQYKQCKKALRRGLDAAPEPSTIELGKEILHGIIQPAPLQTQNALATFNRLTFQRGAVRAARLIADGQVVYAAAWKGNQAETYRRNSVDGAASVIEGLTGAGILCALPSNQLAVSINQRFLQGYISTGTLARTRLDGSETEELLPDVQWADCLPGVQRRSSKSPICLDNFLVVRDQGGLNHLEFPVGNTLYETSGWVSHPRFSPRGDLIAFLHHPLAADDSGAVAVTNLKGEKRTLSSGWVSAQGLAWSSTGEEIWFTATKTGNSRALYAVTLSGQLRLVHREAGSLTLHDISANGHILLTRDDTQLGMNGLVAGETHERDLSWLDWSLGRDLSDDGQMLLFTEAGEGTGMEYGVFLQNLKDSTVRRLGNGSALALSPDARWALIKTRSPHSHLILLPTSGKGEPQMLSNGWVNHQLWASWFPTGDRILFVGNEEGRGSRLYVQDIKGGPPQVLKSVPEGTHIFSTNSISPDGQLIAATNSDQIIHLYPVAEGPPRSVPGVLLGEVPIRWSPDGGFLYVFDRGKVPASVYQINLVSGARVLWRELMPPDSSGVHEILRVR